MTNTAGYATSRSVVTARSWQQAHGAAAVDWMRSSGVAQRMLADVIQSVEATVEFLVGGDHDRAREVIFDYPSVLRCCDRLRFDEPSEAIGYLILHLPDRYCQMFQVMESLLASGRLPMGKNNRFAAIDIGAGPGPGIFAARAFYAALARYAAVHDPSWPIATLGYSDVVERGRAMSWVMHHSGEALIAAERGRDFLASTRQSEPNPCAKERSDSASPFGASYYDFSVLDIRGEHFGAREHLARDLYNIDDLELSLEGARRLAYEEPIGRPSAYALAIMMNFLTPGSQSLGLLSDAIDRLMGSFLVLGGTILALGATRADYQEIYSQLDQGAGTARLRIVDCFDQPLQAGHRPEELTAVCGMTRRLWNHLEAMAGDVTPIKEELRRIGAADIFDGSLPFTLPSFPVRAYRRGA